MCTPIPPLSWARWPHTQSRTPTTCVSRTRSGSSRPGAGRSSGSNPIPRPAGRAVTTCSRSPMPCGKRHDRHRSRPPHRPLPPPDGVAICGCFPTHRSDPRRHDRARPHRDRVAAVGDLEAIVKAYDVRGLVPDQLDEHIGQALGAAAAEELVGSEDHAIVLGHDMRETSPALADALARGITARGLGVIHVGLVSTDALYFASGSLNLPGIMITASHNPAGYNGMKFCRSGARPVSYDTGLRAMAETSRAELASAARDQPGDDALISHRGVLTDYARHLHSLVETTDLRALTVVVDAGNGMAGHTAPVALDLPGLRIDPLYFELDGTFPNHDANPLDRTTRTDGRGREVDTGADLGLAFDGDAGRCFVIDEAVEVVDPSRSTALIAVRELYQVPGSVIVYNTITSRSVPEIVREHGGAAVRARVGHSHMKACMAEHEAIFGGEHSGHYYFRDFWRADSGMLAALHVLVALGQAAPGITLSGLVSPYARYVASGEINSEIGRAHV